MVFVNLYSMLVHIARAPASGRARREKRRLLQHRRRSGTNPDLLCLAYDGGMDKPLRGHASQGAAL